MKVNYVQGNFEGKRPSSLWVSSNTGLIFADKGQFKCPHPTDQRRGWGWVLSTVVKPLLVRLIHGLWRLERRKCCIELVTNHESSLGLNLLISNVANVSARTLEMGGQLRQQKVLTVQKDEVALGTHPVRSQKVKTSSSPCLGLAESSHPIS